MKPTGATNNIRVAWFIPSLARSWRWQPLFKECTKIFRHTAVFVGVWPGFVPAYDGSFDVRKLRGVRFISLRTSEAGSSRGFTWAPPTVLWSLLRFRPACILTNGFDLFTLYALLVKMLIGSRVVLMFQGISPETGEGLCSLKFPVRRILGRFLDLALCNTTDGVNYLRKRVRIPAVKVLHCVFEVPDWRALTTTINRENSRVSGQRTTFLFVGRMIRGKGVKELLQASSVLLRNGLDQFSVILVGDGIHRQEIIELAGDLKLGDHISWVGHVSYDELGNYYENCDVFILPSLEDTWGVVVLEAMAFGKAVICSRCAGVSEMVRHGESGFVFDPHDPYALEGYMERFIRDPALAARFGAKSKEITASCTPERVASTLEQAFLSVVDAESPLCSPQSLPLPEPPQQNEPQPQVAVSKRSVT